jgi:hypothetical protein
MNFLKYNFLKNKNLYFNNFFKEIKNIKILKFNKILKILNWNKKNKFKLL